MASSRETVRDALVVLLEAGLVGVGLPVKTVSGSKMTTLTGNSPLVSILSAGSTREAMTFEGNRLKEVALQVHVWVLQSATGWTRAQSEDALDTIESLIAQIYEDNTNSTNWEILEYSAPTKVIEVAVEGLPYYLEIIPTRATLARN